LLSNIPQVVTAFYKINKISIQNLLFFLKDHMDEMKMGMQYEKLIGYFSYMFKESNKVTYKKCIGVSGHIAINGVLLNK